MDRLTIFRDQFPILSRSTYLVSHSLGAMPVSVFERMKEYADTWAEKGVAAWADEWWDMPVTAAEPLGRLINAPPGSVALHPNVTTMQQIVLSCFEDEAQRRGRNVIVTEERNFPSILYLLRRWSEGHGTELRLVPSSDGVTIDTQRMIDAIDEKTFLVPISHILFRSAYIQDARAIIEKARSVGALVVLDAFQSVGILPVDVQSLNVDILLGGVLKWLCGGPGGAFMYIRPDLLTSMQPRFTGWVAHRRPFEFDPGDVDLREDAADRQTPVLHGHARLRRRQTADPVGQSPQLGIEPAGGAFGYLQGADFFTEAVRFERISPVLAVRGLSQALWMGGQGSVAGLDGAAQGGFQDELASILFDGEQGISLANLFPRLAQDQAVGTAQRVAHEVVQADAHRSGTQDFGPGVTRMDEKAGGQGRFRDQMRAWLGSELGGFLWLAPPFQQHIDSDEQKDRQHDEDSYHVVFLLKLRFTGCEFLLQSSICGDCHAITAPNFFPSGKFIVNSNLLKKMPKENRNLLCRKNKRLLCADLPNEIC